MRVLVTGGTGFLGSHLVERLLEETGLEVYALVRDPSRLRWLEGIEGVRLLAGDLRSVPALPAGLACVYHAAGSTKTLRSSDYYSVNRDGTASLLRALENQSGTVRFVHISSLAAVGPAGPQGGVSEDEDPHPVSAYGASKLQAEKEVVKYRDRFSVVILRLAAVYGPRDEDFLEFFRWIGRGVMPMPGGRKSLSLVYIKDAVRACLMAGQADPTGGGIYNIADPETYGWEDIGRIAAGLLGKKPVRVRFPYWAAWLAAAASEGLGRLTGGGKSLFNVSKIKQMRPDRWVADVRRAREGLGFETRFSLEEALGETIAWYLGKGLI